MKPYAPLALETTARQRGPVVALVDALVLASAALLTTSPWPVWTQAMGTEAWPVGIVLPEIALWLVPLPICFAAAALWLGRGCWRNGRDWRDWRNSRWLTGITSRWLTGITSRWLTGITVALCAAAVMLLSKPAVQAWQMGRTLDATLAAFGRHSLLWPT
jgi:hypothetical protein